MPPPMTFLLLCLSLLYPAETTLLLVLHLLTDSTSLLFCTTLYFNFLLCICFCRRFCSISILRLFRVCSSMVCQLLQMFLFVLRRLMLLLSLMFFSVRCCSLLFCSVLFCSSVFCSVPLRMFHLPLQIIPLKICVLSFSPNRRHHLFLISTMHTILSSPTSRSIMSIRLSSIHPFSPSFPSPPPSPLPSSAAFRRCNRKTPRASTDQRPSTGEVNTLLSLPHDFPPTPIHLSRPSVDHPLLSSNTLPPSSLLFRICRASTSSL